MVSRKITLGKTVQEHFPELEQQGMIGVLDIVFTTGEPFVSDELPVELNTKGDENLEKLYVNLVVQPLKDEEGKTERILAHIIDVTHQVNARKQIEESEKRFSAAVEAVQGILWTNNAKGEMEELTWTMFVLMLQTRLPLTGMHRSFILQTRLKLCSLKRAIQNRQRIFTLKNHQLKIKS